jgi:hypothetical protein
MGRRDPDPRPPIEIVGAAPAAESVQRVSTGPGGPRRSSRRALVAAVAAVVLLLVGGLALGGDDGSGATADGDEEPRDNSAKLPLERSTTTSRPRGSTTTRPPTTTTTIPVGPVLGTPVGAGLLAFGGSGWRLVDLDTGARTIVDLPTQEPYLAVAVRGGVVLLHGDRTAYFHALGPTGERAEPLALGQADQVLPSGRPDQVWLVDGGGRTDEGGDFTDPQAEVRLVGTDGREARSFQTRGSWISYGVEDGVVVERGGRVYLANEDGIRPVASGWTMGVAGDDLLVISCDDQADCSLLRQPLDRSLPRPIVRDVDIESAGYGASTAPDGRVALTPYEEGGRSSLLLLAADGGVIGTVDAAARYDGQPRWLPGDHGLLLPLITGVEWIHREARGWVTTPVPALEDLPAETALLIEW